MPRKGRQFLPHDRGANAFGRPGLLLHLNFAHFFESKWYLAGFDWDFPDGPSPCPSPMAGYLMFSAFFNGRIGSARLESNREPAVQPTAQWSKSKANVRVKNRREPGLRRRGEHSRERELENPDADGFPRRPRSSQSPVRISALGLSVAMNRIERSSHRVRCSAWARTTPICRP